MPTAQFFKAVAVTSEINLNKLANHFGVNRKFKWEDWLTLNELALKGLLPQPIGKAVYIFPFGSLVFVNCEYHEINDIIHYLAQTDKSLVTATNFEFTDDYKVEISDNEPPEINNDCLVAQEVQSYHHEIVATILAKSVALERIENDIDILLDEIEDFIAFLRQGRLNFSDEQLAITSARILGFRLSTISYIMLLDKPEITWVNEDAGALFDKLSLMFELNGRYDNIRHKTETLMDITTVFAGLVHSKRGNRLEWAIIIIISIETCLALISMILK